MDKYEKLACSIIERVSEVVEKHYGITPKNLTEDKIESPALINGTVYYDLESEIAEDIKNLG